MWTKPKEEGQGYKRDSTDEKLGKMMDMMRSLNKGVVLRGSLYEEGGIHSFWLKSRQKNLLALLFELPTVPVKVGDKWSLDVNLIANDQNFDCDSAYKVNEVTLVDVKKRKGEKIAVLKYHHVEYVQGSYYKPSFLGDEGEQQAGMMKFVHEGMAEFSVDKGRWVVYDGVMSLETTGMVTVKKKTRFGLIEE